MSGDLTQLQEGDELRRAQELSLRRTRPPCDLSGYEPRRFLGAGAYGEVWVALDRNTGRQVAIKYYSHRGGLDWSLLSREVEKLAFLSADRYVVQLLEVGWDAEPPYYVMEYVEQGSLEERLRNGGPLPVETAVALFRDVVTGLVHAHGKGVLHCDLKPGNVLLDQDDKPRLADFGQSRLSHEQLPALGTLFYMAPEQADLKATPDAGWDVYALGALMYAMLTGRAPHHTDDSARRLEAATNLEDRLAAYRKLLRSAPRPAAHRSAPGVDRHLAEIVDQCLAVDPRQRFANAQAVLDALDARTRRRARRPLLLLGAVGPALLLATLALLAWRMAGNLVAQSAQALTNQVVESNQFAAQYVARLVANELEQRYRAIEDIAQDPSFQQYLIRALTDPNMAMLRTKLNDPDLDEERWMELNDNFRKESSRENLQQYLNELPRKYTFAVASWFVTDASGLQVARSPESPTIGRNFGWRSYFHGQAADHPETWRPESGDHINETFLSPVFRSHATRNWVVAISTPVYAHRSDAFLGVVTLTVDVGSLIDLHAGENQFAVLVDWRRGNRGLILQHPLFERLVKERQPLPDQFEQLRLTEDDLPTSRNPDKKVNYVDPISRDALGVDFDRRWLAGEADVTVRDADANPVDTGWFVIVQESYDSAIGSTLDALRRNLVKYGLLAVGLAAALLTALWGFVILSINRRVTKVTIGANLPASASTGTNTVR